MYVELEGEEVDRSPLCLGDKRIKPGQFISRLGEKKRKLALKWQYLKYFMLYNDSVEMLPIIHY